VFQLSLRSIKTHTYCTKAKTLCKMGLGSEKSLWGVCSSCWEKDETWKGVKYIANAFV